MKHVSLILLTVIFLSCGASKNKIKDFSGLNSKASSLFISDGTQFVPRNFYPNFNWKVTPQYFMFGDGINLLSNDL